jgi:hypothetical protein
VRYALNSAIVLLAASESPTKGSTRAQATFSEH